MLGKGSRLRLVIGPINSLHADSGVVVVEESAKDARKVAVTLYHDRSRPSTWYVPIGRYTEAARQGLLGRLSKCH